MNTQHDQARRLRELARQTRDGSAATMRVPAMIVVAGGCAGVGATTVSSQLAKELGHQWLNVELQAKWLEENQARCNADIVLIDAGAGSSPQIVQLWKRAGLVLLVTTPMQEAVLGAYAALKLANCEQCRTPIYLLPNRCADELEADVLHRRISDSCHRFLDREIAAAPWLPEWETNLQSKKQSVALLARFVCELVSPSSQANKFRQAA
jgi:MinD-like ATPase involved in chromosome partitioning or flagellar assembly